jgi:hypothetical protein
MVMRKNLRVQKYFCFMCFSLYIFLFFIFQHVKFETPIRQQLTRSLYINELDILHSFISVFLLLNDIAYDLVVFGAWF